MTGRARLTVGDHLFMADHDCRLGLMTVGVGCVLARASRAQLSDECVRTGHRKREIVDAHHANSIRLRPLSPQPPELADSRLIDPDKLLDANLNEVFLYHGTSYDVASIITQHGFDER